MRPKPQGQVFIAKGSSPWYNSGDWPDIDKVISTDESISGQATVTCKGVTNMSCMFYDCPNITALDLSNFNASNVTNMHSTFSACSKLTSLDLFSFDTSNVTNMSMMFYYCAKLTALDLSNFNTSKVKDMDGMFWRCTNLTSLDLSSFDTSKVTNMMNMFYDCSSLTTIKGVIDMKSCTFDFFYLDMFRNCTKLTGVKIKNPPSGFNGEGLSSSQYTIVS